MLHELLTHPMRIRMYIDDDSLLPPILSTNILSSFRLRLQDEMLKRALEAYSEFLSTPLEELKFWFDGEGVSPMDTPESLDMEEQATIDVTRR